MLQGSSLFYDVVVIVVTLGQQSQLFSGMDSNEMKTKITEIFMNLELNTFCLLINLVSKFIKLFEY